MNLSSVSALVADELRSSILSGQLRPGERINIDKMAEAMGVSRTPVREALHRLRLEGMVDIRPRVGVFVHDLTDDEVREVYAIKRAIEPIAARLAAERASPAERTVMRDLVAEMAGAVARDDISGYAALVERFHEQLHTIASSGPLLDVYRVVNGRVRVMRRLNLERPGRLKESLAQHERIAEAVAVGDGLGAEAAMATHMADAQRSLLKVLEGERAQPVPSP